MNFDVSLEINFKFSFYQQSLTIVFLSSRLNQIHEILPEFTQTYQSLRFEESFNKLKKLFSVFED